MRWFPRSLLASASSATWRLAGVCTVLAMAGCLGKSDKAATQTDVGQIVAKVNDSEISIHQVQARLESQPALAEQLGQAAPAKVLDSLIEQELAAQAARQAGLDSSPKVLQAMELAKREVLARAYQDQLADKVTMPDTEAVNRYYEAHPELFAQRRRYTLQETMLTVPADQAREIKDKVEHLASVEAVNSLIGTLAVPHASRNSVQWAEALPMDLLAQLAYLKPGQSIGVMRPEGLLVLTIMNAETAPVTVGQASKAITAAIVAGERREAVKKGMDALRAKAQIQKLGPMADQAASAAAGASAASAAP
jgi:EpsD family peptidyl-prolyl cis-trans isomerase